MIWHKLQDKPKTGVGNWLWTWMDVHFQLYLVLFHFGTLGIMDATIPYFTLFFKILAWNFFRSCNCTTQIWNIPLICRKKVRDLWVQEHQDNLNDHVSGNGVVINSLNVCCLLKLKIYTSCCKVIFSSGKLLWKCLLEFATCWIRTAPCSVPLPPCI